MTTLPQTGATELVASQAIPETAANAAFRLLDAGFSRSIIEDRDLATPPGTCSDGARYLIASSPTGAWAGQTGKLAIAIGTNAANGWKFVTVAREGFKLYIRDENAEIVHDGSSWVSASGGGYSGGVQSTPILAAAMTPRTTSGAASGTTETSTNKIMLATLDFDPSTVEYAQFMFPMPKSWNESTVTAQFIWTATTTGDVVWGIQGVAMSDDDALDAAFGTAQTVTDSVTATTDLMQSAFTSAVTIGGTPAEGDLVCFQVYRNATSGSDTVATDARLIGIRLNFTTSAADDL